MNELKVIIYRSHGLTSIVERFNQTLAKALYGFQYKKELDSGKVNRQWVDILQKVINNINDEYTRLIDMSPNEAVKKAQSGERVKQNPGVKFRDSGLKELKVGDHVRYLLTGGEHDSSKQDNRRSTDPYRSLDIFEVVKIMTLIEPGFYYLEGVKGRKLREELQLVEWLVLGDGPEQF